MITKMYLFAELASLPVTIAREESNSSNNCCWPIGWKVREGVAGERLKENKGAYQPRGRAVSRDRIGVSGGLFTMTTTTKTTTMVL